MTELSVQDYFILFSGMLTKGMWQMQTIERRRNPGRRKTYQGHKVHGRRKTDINAFVLGTNPLPLEGETSEKMKELNIKDFTRDEYQPNLFHKIRKFLFKC